ncbi:transmembrane protease serine 9-like [Pieris brassicae]|uniref:transmembrane protease serine 9-like n=1 Tax=Pieris brassicae TaxID=7116 RepID=UPI001E6620DC|nr:transmembrane protease serine 9-like [Pieris brassicae]
MGRVILCVLFVIFDFGLCYINLADIECGAQSFRNARIVGGTSSQPAEFPWAASIWRQGTHQCGATVISDRWLITAGHCVCNVFDAFYKAKQLTAVVGFTDISTSDRNEALSSIVPHPDYRCKKKTNDVALLKTIRQLIWSSSIRPACLPQPLDSDYSGQLATVAGWGFTHEDRGIGERPNVLQKTDVLVVNNDVCNDWYKSQGSKVRIIGTQMCAGHESGGRDSCWADSGGPLMTKNENGHTMLIGVVSTGSGCARAKMPGIYTRVSRYTEWIQTSVSEDTSRSSLRWFSRTR